MTVFNYSFMSLPKAGRLMLCALPKRDEDFALIKSNACLLISTTETSLPIDGLDVIHLPTPDYTPPSKTAWQTHSLRAHTLLEAGETIAIHCHAGLGRTGTLAAMILIERGLSAIEAIAYVRSHRQGAIETGGQEAFLLGYRS